MKRSNATNVFKIPDHDPGSKHSYRPIFTISENYSITTIQNDFKEVMEEF